MIGKKYGLEYHTIMQLYWLNEPGWSSIDIAKYYGCDHVMIIRFMKQQNIPRRTKSEAGIEAWKNNKKRKNLEESITRTDVNERRRETMRNLYKESPEMRENLRKGGKSRLKYNFDIEDVKERYLINKESLKKIAEYYGCLPNSLSNFMIEHNILKRNEGGT